MLDAREDVDSHGVERQPEGEGLLRTRAITMNLTTSSLVVIPTAVHGVYSFPIEKRAGPILGRVEKDARPRLVS